MEKFQLQVFLNIIGIGSASGLLFHNDSLFIISDNSSYLYEYQINKKELTKIALNTNPKENIPKKEKLDFESITKNENKLYLFGSGSTENRNLMLTYHLENEKIKSKDLSELYSRLRTLAKLKEDELNIEGAISVEDKMYLFQRGNGGADKNGLFIVEDDKTKPMYFHPIPLPKINAVEYTFTDAILVHDKIYFLAAAENSNSTYLDGEVLGSLVGILNPKTFEVEQTIVISDNHKFEGITLYKESSTELEFLLCEDNDTEILETKIYKLKLSK
jgi:hypothetical protein